jgi:hypothetical protein
MPEKVSEEAFPITPQELDLYCERRTQISQRGARLGGQQLTNYWYLTHIPGLGYGKVWANDVKEDADYSDPNKMRPLEEGEEFRLSDHLRKVHLW